MLKIRLMRIGAKKRPFYRVVVVDERAKRTGAYIELLGTYNPLTEPKDIKLKQDRIDHWVKQGAQLSTGFLRIIGKAPQRPPRKPKKEKKAEPSAVTDQPSEKPTEEATKEEPKTGSEPAEETTPKENGTEVKSDEKSAKSEVVEAIGEVERTTEPNESSPKQGAKQTNSEPIGEASGASGPDEPTNSSNAGDQANIEPTPESEKKSERPA